MSDNLHPTATDSSERPIKLRWLRWNLHHVMHACLLLAAVGLLLLGSRGWILVIPAILMALILADGIARPGSNIFYPTITHGPRDSKRVALSFDDGPDPVITAQVLDVLAEAGARATFFVIGKSLAAQPALARRMLNECHCIGNHSWQHSRWQNFRSFRWQLREIDSCQEAIAKITGEPKPRLYRPPVGLKNWAVAQAAWHRGLRLVAWSLHSHDTLLPDPERIAERVLGRIRGGDIVLLHDGHDLPGRQRPHCAPAVKLILRGLQARGLECVTIPELLNPPTAAVAGPEP